MGLMGFIGFREFLQGFKNYPSSIPRRKLGRESVDPLAWDSNPPSVPYL